MARRGTGDRREGFESAGEGLRGPGYRRRPPKFLFLRKSSVSERHRSEVSLWEGGSSLFTSPPEPTFTDESLRRVRTRNRHPRPGGQTTREVDGRNRNTSGRWKEPGDTGLRRIGVGTGPTLSIYCHLPSTTDTLLPGSFPSVFRPEKGPSYWDGGGVRT